MPKNWDQAPFNMFFICIFVGFKQLILGLRTEYHSFSLTRKPLCLLPQLFTIFTLDSRWMRATHWRPSKSPTFLLPLTVLPTLSPNLARYAPTCAPPSPTFGVAEQAPAIPLLLDTFSSFHHSRFKPSMYPSL